MTSGCESGNDKNVRASFFGSRFLYVVIAFAAVNLLIFLAVPQSHPALTAESIKNSTSEQRQQGPWVWWMARSYLNDAPSDVVLMGSSQLACAVFSADADLLNKNLDAVLHRSALTLQRDLKQDLGVNLKAFNFAVGGAMVSDHFLIAKALFSQRKPKVAIIGVNPRDFIDNCLPSASDTEPFQFLQSYVSLGDLTRDSFSSPLQELDWRLNNYLPMKQIKKLMQGNDPPTLAGKSTFTNPGNDVAPEREQGTKVSKAKLLQALSATGGQPRPGEWLIPARPPYAFIDNTREYMLRYKDSKPAIYPHEKRYFEALLAYLEQQGIKTLVVGMPSLAPNRALLPENFWSEFRGSLALACSKHDAQWVDLFDSNDFSDGDYLDTVHLNRNGGAKLLKLIAATVEKTPSLAAALTEDDRKVAGSKPQEAIWK